MSIADCRLPIRCGLLAMQCVWWNMWLCMVHGKVCCIFSVFHYVTYYDEDLNMDSDAFLALLNIIKFMGIICVGLRTLIICKLLAEIALNGTQLHIPIIILVQCIIIRSMQRSVRKPKRKSKREREREELKEGVGGEICCCVYLLFFNCHTTASYIANV